MANTFLDLANDVLRKAEKPLTYQEIWQVAQETGLASKLGTTGKTPWQTLGAQLYLDVRDNETTRFIKVGKRPARFFLKSRSTEVSDATAAVIEQAEDKRPKKSVGYKERDLHPILTYFAFASPSFNRGRAIVTKTIHHESAKKPGYSEWNYPDMAGFSIPLEDWQQDVIAFNEMIDRNALTLFSFEMKRSLTKSSYRESFFQAVSNSSWAHQGFLVAAEITEDDDLHTELERLASSFGIGVIHLQLEDLSESRVLYPAKVRTNLDWETINKLCEQNKDFAEFLRSVQIDVKARKVHRGEYDPVIKDIDDYVKKTSGR